MIDDGVKPAGSQRVASVLLSWAGLAGLLTCYWALESSGLLYNTLRFGRADTLPILYGMVFLTAIGGALAPTRYRRVVQLSISVAAYPLVLGLLGLAVLGWAAIVCTVARMRVRLRVRILALFGAWLAFPLWKISGGATESAPPLLFGVVWAGLAFSGLYLLVERDRGTLADLGLGDELFYLLAIPRIATPFFQPISPAYLYRAERTIPAVSTTGRALGLGAWAIAVGVFVTAYARLQLDGLPAPVVLFLGITRAYATNAMWIFAAVPVFRLLGFDIGSGFRTPFLSKSFAELFRRWNYYIRDFVLLVLFMPLLGWLRLKLPRWVTKIVAAYLAIFFGAFGLTSIIVPLATSRAPLATLPTLFAPERLLMLFLFWTAIIVPQTGLGRVLIQPTSRWRAVLRWVLFLLLFCAYFLAGVWLEIGVL